MPSAIQRRAPLTPLPINGISTKINSNSEAMNRQGAAFCHKFTGTWNASNATTNATAMEATWRTRKWVWA